jgi:hypothetical protein
MRGEGGVSQHCEATFVLAPGGGLGYFRPLLMRWGFDDAEEEADSSARPFRTVKVPGRSFLLGKELYVATPHTPAFWLRVERAMPDFAQRKTWLAEHGIDVEGI